MKSYDLIILGTGITGLSVAGQMVKDEHDCHIFEHSHISTNAVINGGVVVESGCFIGSGAITKESITIQKNSFIKAGSVVT